MDSHHISDRIARMEGLDRVAQPMRKVARALFGAMGRGVEDFLHGVFLGHPLHPILIHLPIGGFTVAAIMDLFVPSLSYIPILIGVIGAVPAAIAGMADWHVYESPAIRRIGIAHALLNTVSLGFYILSLVARGFDLLGLGVLLAYLGFAVVMASGYLGGVLVYEKKLGTNHAPEHEDEAAPTGFVPVLRESDLFEGRPTAVRVGEMDVVLVRLGTEIHAFSATCAHQGGPLGEGTVENGCLVCPWHFSAFRLGDGSVAAGPSPFAQPKYECRVANGFIEVRAHRVEQPQLEFETPHGRASLR